MIYYDIISYDMVSYVEYNVYYRVICFAMNICDDIIPIFIESIVLFIWVILLSRTN